MRQGSASAGELLGAALKRWLVALVALWRGEPRPTGVGRGTLLD
ncbi:MAG: hypothetical protein ABJG55_00260 [Paracoccaceae bacterium]